MPFPTLRLRADADLPAYLQIKHQVAFAIHCADLLPGDRLPPIREVAKDLDVNAATVAQAYAELQAEGLIESTPGRGSFVRAGRDEEQSADLVARRRLLDEAVRSTFARAAALGFSAADVREHVAAYADQVHPVRTIVLVSVTRRTALRYAAAVEEMLNGRVRVQALGTEDLARADGFARAPFALAYDLWVFGPNVPAVEAFLARTRVAADVRALTTQVTERTVEDLSGLRPGERVQVLTHGRYTNVTERLVTEHGRARPEDVRVTVADGSLDLVRATEGADVVVYNSALHEALQGVLRPGQRAVEIVFELSADSAARIRRRYADG